jgi:two-component system, OmpR family, sensor histidine kinase ArlS
MSLRTRLTITFTLLFVTIIVALNTFVYVSYSSFRRDDFYARLREKAITTVTLLADVNENEQDLLQTIDRNTMSALYDEKTLIFDDSLHLIYSSISNHKVSFSVALLQKIKQQREYRYTNTENTNIGDDEAIGIYYTANDGKHYVLLASAYDSEGRTKLNQLRWTLLLATIVGISLAGMAGRWFIRNAFKPIIELRDNVLNITENNLNKPIQINAKRHDEITELAMAYNAMLARLGNAFAAQTDFVRHASHELRTPIATMMSTVETALQTDAARKNYKTVLLSMSEELDKMAELINSLLILNKISTFRQIPDEGVVRIDDLLFEVLDKATERYATLKYKIDFVGEISTDNAFEICANRVLLGQLCFNLVENAFKYGNQNPIIIQLSDTTDTVGLNVLNMGNTLDAAEQARIFMPFERGTNAHKQKGYGLGLAICQRIIAYYKGSLTYSVQAGMNCFAVTLIK